MILVVLGGSLLSDTSAFSYTFAVGIMKTYYIMKIRVSMEKMILMLTLLLAFTQLSAKNYIRLIRNATLKMEYAGKQILVDPMLGAKGSLGLALGVNINPRVNLTIPVEDVLDGLDFNLGLMKNLEVIS